MLLHMLKVVIILGSNRGGRKSKEKKLLSPLSFTVIAEWNLKWKCLIFLQQNSKEITLRMLCVTLMYFLNYWSVVFAEIQGSLKNQNRTIDQCNCLRYLSRRSKKRISGSNFKQQEYLPWSIPKEPRLRESCRLLEMGESSLSSFW